MIARKLLDNFLDSLTLDQKEEIYGMALNDMNEAMARMANLYEEIFKDYPGGILAAFMQQHLKDKVFQKTHQAVA